MKKHVLVMMGLLLGLGPLAACVSSAAGKRGRDEVPYAFIYLKTGPDSASHTPEQKQEIFKGHMSNMQRLAKEKTLIIAGPFVKPRDSSWRGLFIFDGVSIEEARRIAATDPGVSSGEFVTDIRAAWGPPSLRDALKLEEELQSKLKAQGAPQRKEGEPPPSLRAYVIVHADDIDRTSAAIRTSRAARPGSAPVPPAILWSLQFQGTHAGVMVVDATNVPEVQDTLEKLDAGKVACDGWFSTKALEGL
ncbi:MAG: YciI family protein [Phycisphaerales bacterium]